MVEHMNTAVGIAAWRVVNRNRYRCYLMLLLLASLTILNAVNLLVLIDRTYPNVWLIIDEPLLLLLLLLLLIGYYFLHLLLIPWHNIYMGRLLLLLFIYLLSKSLFKPRPINKLKTWYLTCWRLICCCCCWLCKCAALVKIVELLLLLFEAMLAECCCCCKWLFGCIKSLTSRSSSGAVRSTSNDKCSAILSLAVCNVRLRMLLTNNRQLEYWIIRLASIE